MAEGAPESEIGTGVVSWQPVRNRAAAMPKIHFQLDRMSRL